MERRDFGRVGAWVGILLASVLLWVGCGEDAVLTPPPCTPGEVNVCPCPSGLASVQTCQPDRTYGPCACSDVPNSSFVVARFFIDDTSNRTYTDEDGLTWRGSFSYDPATNVLTPSEGRWAGPFVPMFDDGPRATGGHEPDDAVAGDNMFTVEVRIPLPSAETTVEYGANRNDPMADGGWIWPPGQNGRFVVRPDMTPDELIEVDGLVIREFGSIDMRFTLDAGALDPDFAGGAPLTVQVKSSAWGWSLIDLAQTGAHMWSMVLSEHVGSSTLLRNAGLPRPGDEVAFTFVLDGEEYKVDGIPPKAGVTVESWNGVAWVTLGVGHWDGTTGNTYVTLPD
jgi:hypothetical protein